MKKRIDYIDIAKGMGIMLVIMCHTGYLGKMAPYINAFFMPLFFVTAGLVYRRSGDIKSVLKKKFKALLVPYFVWNLFYILFTTVVSGKGFNIYSFYGVIYGRYTALKLDDTISAPVILLRNCNTHLWFLPCMFITAFTYATIDIYLTNWKKHLCVLFLATVGGVLGYISPIYPPFSIDTALVMLLFYDLGVIIQYKMNVFLRFEEKHKKIVFICLISLFVAFLIGVGVNGGANISLSYYGKNVLLFFIVACIGSCILLYISIKISKLSENNKIKTYLLFLGKNSMDIYLMHMLLDVALARFVNRGLLLFEIDEAIIQSGVISFVFVPVVSVIAYIYCLVKTKIHKFLI